MIDPKDENPYSSHRLEAEILSIEDARERAKAQGLKPLDRSASDRIDAWKPGAKTKEWQEPRPISNPLAPVPPFDPALLPSDLKPWILDIANRMQVPLEMVAVAAMCALSVVVCSARTIKPKRHDDWRVWPVLWGVAIAPAGSKKTPSMKEALRPLDMLDARARKFWKDDAPRREAQLAVAKAKNQAAQDQLKKAAKNHADDSLLDIAMRAQEHQAPDTIVRPRRYTTTDTTVEKISDLVNRAGENKRSYPIGIMRDELIGLMQTFERDGREGDRAYYLEGWSVADKSTDRIGRGEVFVKDLCLIVFGNATPGPFEAYVREATSGKDADGFMQRIQGAVYPDPIRSPKYVDQKPDKQAFLRALGVFERIDNIRDEDESGKPPALRFADDAQEFFQDWFTELERKLAGSDGENHALISHYSKYRSLMPTMALIIHLASKPGNEDEPVSMHAAKAAAGWCALLGAHAQRIYGISSQPESGAVQGILKRIRQGKLEGEMTLRAIERSMRGTDAGAILKALELLEEHGWCRIQQVKLASGGRAQVRVEFHPAGKDFK